MALIINDMIVVEMTSDRNSDGALTKCSINVCAESAISLPYVSYMISYVMFTYSDLKVSDMNELYTQAGKSFIKNEMKHTKKLCLKLCE